MGKRLKNILKVTVGILGTIVVLLGVGTWLLNTSYVQQRLLRRATAMLAERVGTRVEADSISVNLFGPSLALHGLSVDDQQGQPLLNMKRLKAEVGIASWRERRLAVKEVETTGLEARLMKADKDSVANYQFLIDAFAKKKKPEQEKDSLAKPPAQKGPTFHLHHLRLKDTHISYQVAERKTSVAMQQLDVKRHGTGYRIGLDSLHLKTDNGKPRKDVGRPNKGHLDAGHLDLTTTMRWTVNLVRPDSLNATLTEATIHDPTSGINIGDLRMAVAANREKLHLTDIALSQGSTTLNINRATLTLPDKKTERQLAYTVDSIKGHVILCDIAHPFAPVLREFRMPLQLNAEMRGTAEEMIFPHMRVSTDDNRLRIAASGRIDHLQDKQLFAVSFDVNQLLAKQGMAEKVVNQFIVKKLMMNQLQQLGDIGYRGHFDVAWRREDFRGRITTKAGAMDVRCSIDENEKHVRGSFQSKAIRIGEVMEMPAIGDVDCHTEFDIDISKQRTARIRGKKGGKLPIGTVTATVNDCSYKKIHVRNIIVNIQSNGSDAVGNVVQQGKHRQITCQFVYNESDPKHKLRITDTGISFRKQQDGAKPKDKNKNEKKDKTKESKKSTKKEKKSKKDG